MSGVSRTGAAVAVCAAVVAACGIAVTGGAAQAVPDGTGPAVAVPASVPAAVGGAAWLGAVPASQQLTVQVWLTPDAGRAAAFADAVSTPGSPALHHYLSPDAYAARFGPSAAQAGAVTSWLAGRGLTGVHVAAGRDYVSATGPVQAVESAFQVRIGRYRAGSAASATAGRPQVFTSNDRAVSVPAALAPDVLGVTGLSSAPGASRSTTTAAPRSTTPVTSRSTAIPAPFSTAAPTRPVSTAANTAARPTTRSAATSATRPASTPATRPASKLTARPATLPAAKAATCSRYWAQHVHALHPAYQGLARAALPVCGYSAAQLRAAYGANWRDTGKGQTVALTEDESPTAMFRTLTAYARSNHLPLPKPSQFRQVKAGTASCKTSSAEGARAAQSPPVDVEAEMDSEAVYAMAPAANQVMVVGSGCDEDQALLNAVSAVLAGDGHRPLASIASNSWQIPIGMVSPKIVHALDVRAAAEGVGLYFASGDTTGLTVTASDPYALVVGGTTLGIGPAGKRVFETGWSSGSGSLDGGKWTDIGISGGGGGVSDVYRQPSYQRGVVPASMAKVTVGGKTVLGRTVPDIAAAADPDTGMLTGYTDTDENGKPGRYRTVSSAGTSLATPLVAGLVADAQQGRKSPFGFINPLLYSVARTHAFHDALPISKSAPQQDRAAYIAPDETFTDPGVDVFDTHRRPDTDQVTTKGYDTTTGLGTPNGPTFLAALRRCH